MEIYYCNKCDGVFTSKAGVSNHNKHSNHNDHQVVILDVKKSELEGVTLFRKQLDSLYNDVHEALANQNKSAARRARKALLEFRQDSIPLRKRLLEVLKRKLVSLPQEKH